MAKIAHYYLKSKVARLIPLITAFVLLFGLIPTYAQNDGNGQISFVTKRGESIEDAKIFRIEPDGISLMLPSGINKVYFEELPDELCERFHLNATNAVLFRTQRAAQIRAREEKAREVLAQRLEEQKHLEAQRKAERDKQAQATEEKRKIQANHTWHLISKTIRGRVLLVKNDTILIQIASRSVKPERCRFEFSDLPQLSERNLARWIGEHLSPEEQARGESMLKELVAAQEAQRKREEEAAEYNRRRMEIDSINAHIDNAIRNYHPFW